MKTDAKQDQHTFRPGNAESQRGFSLPEIASVMVIAGALAAPIVTAATSSQDALRTEETRIALDRAKVALISFAAKNNGCLPLAADSEGGLPEAGDTGIGVLNSHGGDLPWAELDLPDTFLDGEGLRIQYYVASTYTDDRSDPNEIACAAGHRGEEWAPWAAYPGSASDPFYVYYTPSGGDRQLYKIIGALPAGTPPDAADASIAVEVGDTFPNSLLELRRGPVLTSNSGGQKDIISAQNAFVLIAPGSNVNGELNDSHIRDANHGGNGGPASAWPSGFNTVDGVTFSAARDIDESDNTESGDDTLLVVSFLTYRTELKNKYGMHMEPFCDTDSPGAGAC